MSSVAPASPAQPKPSLQVETSHFFFFIGLSERIVLNLLDPVAVKRTLDEDFMKA